jgi:hypothetical protein
MFNKKIESMSVKEFMNRGKETLCESELIAFEEVEQLGTLASISLLPLAIGSVTKAIPASAATYEAVSVTANAEMYDRMVRAFDPLIVLVQALAYPIATVVVLGGGIMVMIGMKEKGYSLMMGAGLGYVLVNMTPMVLNILVDAMKAV